MNFLFVEGVIPHSSVTADKARSQQKNLEIAIESTEKQVEIWFTNVPSKMMFVSGETAEPSPETTTLIEEITRQQVIEIVST